MIYDWQWSWSFHHMWFFPFYKFCEWSFQDFYPYFYERMHLLFDIFTWKRTICQVGWKHCSSFIFIYNVFDTLKLFLYSNSLIFVHSSFHVMHKTALPHPNIYPISIFKNIYLRIYYTSKQNFSWLQNISSRIIKTMALSSTFNIYLMETLMCGVNKKFIP